MKIMHNGKPAFWQVHTELLFKEIIDNNPSMAIVARPLDVMAKILYVMAEVALEIDNEELNSLCCRLTLFAQADKESPDFDEKAIKLIHKWDKKFMERLNQIKSK